MKRWMICLMMVLTVTTHSQEITEKMKREFQKAGRDGAKAKVTFRVIDSLGNLVTNANVRIGFTQTSVAEGRTDTNGIFVAEGVCPDYASCQFTKEGYYMTEFQHRFAHYIPDVLKDGKWQPWNPTVEVLLKEKRNPIPMYAKQVDVRLPKRNEAFGFDFKVGDLVKPHGKGEQADLLLMCTIEEREHFQDFKRELFITAVQEEEGTLVNTIDTRSQFKSDYEAQEDGYMSQYHLTVDSRASVKRRQERELANMAYLTFRSRIVRDRENKIVSSNYGKIREGTIDYGRDEKNPEGARVLFMYYFNPTPNDYNLEYDPNENLFDKKKFQGMQP